MANIFDLVTAKEIAAYYTSASKNRVPYLGEVLFPARKQKGLNLSWIKGSNGAPAVLKPAAFDAQAVLRDRVGVEKIQQDMTFFKEAMIIKEVDRQELNNLAQSGNTALVDIVIGNIFNDAKTLIDAAAIQRERLRMQLISTAAINVAANGQTLDYDYHMPAEHKAVAAVPWSEATSASPIEDLFNWMTIVEDDTGVRPTRAICSRKTWSYLLNNVLIKSDFNIAKGDRLILTDSLLDQYLVSKIGLKVQVYNNKYRDEENVLKPYYPDDTITLIPEGILGYTWFGVTPEESDLLASSVANVSIVDTGVAVTTSKRTDPVNVETKVSMITIPSFEHIDEIFIAQVA